MKQRQIRHRRAHAAIRRWRFVWVVRPKWFGVDLASGPDRSSVTFVHSRITAEELRGYEPGDEADYAAKHGTLFRGEVGRIDADIRWVDHTLPLVDPARRE